MRKLTSNVNNDYLWIMVFQVILFSSLYFIIFQSLYSDYRLLLIKIITYTTNKKECQAA